MKPAATPLELEVEKALYGKRRSKYNVAAKADRTADNIVFDSKREMEVYLQLKALQRAGTITNLRLQQPFALWGCNPERPGSQKHVATYYADFAFDDVAGRLNVYEAKGKATDLYKLKKRWFEVCYPLLRIIEV